MALKNQSNRFIASRRADRRAGGFSLIEVSIALMVIGVLLAAALATYNIYKIRADVATFNSRVQVIQSALTRYVYRYGRYPLPAPRNSALGTATFGREVTAGSIVACTAPTLASGVVCSSATNTYNGDGVGGADTIFMGDVPFATLGIRYDNIIDTWGNKFVYVISQNLTVPASGTTGYHESYGAIEVLNSVGGTVFTASPVRAHYALVSPGVNHRGGFGLNGQRIAACTGAGLDVTNCDGDGTFRSNLDFSSAPTAFSYGRVITNLSPGATYFDDQVFYANSTSFGIWTKVPAPVAGQVSLANTNAQNIKIGAFAASELCGAGCTALPLTKLDVGGSIRADKVYANRWCGDGNGCTDPGLGAVSSGNLAPITIGGVPTTPGAVNEYDNGPAFSLSYRNYNPGGGILCSGNRALRGIYVGDEMCSQTTYGSAATRTKLGACSAGHYAVGLNSDQSVCCDDTLPCH